MQTRHSRSETRPYGVELPQPAPLPAAGPLRPAPGARSMQCADPSPIDCKNARLASSSRIHHPLGKAIRNRAGFRAAPATRLDRRARILGGRTILRPKRQALERPDFMSRERVSRVFRRATCDETRPKRAGLTDTPEGGPVPTRVLRVLAAALVRSIAPSSLHS